jgi:hypothetical protein
VSGWGCFRLSCRRGHALSGGYLFLLVVLHLFLPVSTMRVHGILIFCGLFGQGGTHRQISYLAVIVVVVQFKQKKKKGLHLLLHL